MSCHALVTIQLANNDCMHTIARDITAGRPGASFTVLITAAALLLTSPPSNTMGCASKPSTPGMRLNLMQPRHLQGGGATTSMAHREEGVQPVPKRPLRRIFGRGWHARAGHHPSQASHQQLAFQRPDSLSAGHVPGCNTPESAGMCPTATPLSESECTVLKHASIHYMHA